MAIEQGGQDEVELKAEDIPPDDEIAGGDDDNSKDQSLPDKAKNKSTSLLHASKSNLDLSDI